MGLSLDPIPSSPSLYTGPPALNSLLSDSFRGILQVERDSLDPPLFLTGTFVLIVIGREGVVFHPCVSPWLLLPIPNCPETCLLRLPRTAFEASPPSGMSDKVFFLEDANLVFSSWKEASILAEARSLLHSVLLTPFRCRTWRALTRSLNGFPYFDSIREMWWCCGDAGR